MDKTEIIFIDLHTDFMYRPSYRGKKSKVNKLNVENQKDRCKTNRQQNIAGTKKRQATSALQQVIEITMYQRTTNTNTKEQNKMTNQGFFSKFLMGRWGGDTWDKNPQMPKLSSKTKQKKMVF